MKNITKRLFIAGAWLALFIFNLQLPNAFAQGTAFTYQGKLQNNGSPANGSYDLSFSLFNLASGGVAAAGPITNSATPVTNGLFSVVLDFGSGVFTGTNYWLDISVRTNGGGAFTALSPRQALTPVPYAIMANSASNLLGVLPASQVGGGTASVNISGSAASFTGSLSGDVTGTQGATVVSKVGGVTAANVASGANAANAATPLNTVAAIMKRDAGGSFSAQSAVLSGNLTLPATTASVGAINIGSGPVLHAYGFQNVFAGGLSGNFTLTGEFDTAIGYGSLYNNTSGINDTALGNSALFSNTTGIQNSSVGGLALSANTVGSDNTGIGFSALTSNRIGSNNVAVGSSAMLSNSNGMYNVAAGWHAQYADVSGSFNVSLGEEAMIDNANGSFNVAIGGESLALSPSGFNNTAVGNQALYAATGNGNIGVGAGAGSSLTAGDNNIDIGNSGNAGEAATIRIGVQGTQTKTFVAGISGATAASGVAVFVNSSGQLGTLTSSARYKDNIQTMGETSDVLLSLRPVTFRYKPEIDPEHIPQFGLVAEEVNKVDPDLVAHDAEGKIYTVRYEAVNAMLLNEFLKQHRTVQEEGTRIESLKQENAALAERLQQLEATVKALSDRKQAP